MQKEHSQPASISLPGNDGAERVLLSELEGITFSPYLLWAAATGYRHFSLTQRAGELEIPVLIELTTTHLKEGAATQALAKHSSVRVGKLYTSPALHLRDSRYLTAFVLAGSFFRALRDDENLRVHVSALDFCAPIRDGFSTTPTDQNEPASSGLWLDKFCANKYEKLCAKSTGSEYTQILGIADDGIAILNQSFTVPETDETRFIAFWDQNSAIDRRVYSCTSSIAQPGYGIELSQSDINTMLADEQDEASHYAQLNPHRLGTARSHGTAVLAIAATGHEKPLIGVQLPVSTGGDDDSGLGLGVAILDALRFMLDRCDAWWWQQRQERKNLALPQLVVNISYGKQAGPHDGSSLIERAIDELIELRTLEGAAHLKVIFSAGNDHKVKCHATVEKLPTGKHSDFHWQVLPDDSTPSFLEAYILGQPEKIGVELISPDGKSVTAKPLYLNHAYHQEKPTGEIAPSTAHLPCGGSFDSIVLAALPATRNGEAQSGKWLLRLRNDGASDAQVLAWIQGDNSRPDQTRRGRQSYFLNGHDKHDAFISTANTLNALATGKHTLSAGALVHATQEPADYSSRCDKEKEPTAYFPVDTSDNQPGKLVAGTLTASYTRMGGTSLAAPQFSSWIIQEWAGSDNKPLC